MTQPSARERHAWVHRNLVIAQLIALSGLACVLGGTGLGKWSFASWLLSVLLMLVSLGMQLRWRAHESADTPPPAGP